MTTPAPPPGGAGAPVGGPDALRGRAAAGVRWGVFDQVVQTAVRFAAMIVLARLVGPLAFGLMGMVWVIVNLLALVTGLGLSEAIVQKAEVDDTQVRVAFTASLATGVALAGVSVVGAWAAAWLFGEPRLVPLLVVMSVTFLFTGAEQTPNDMLIRELRFRDYYLSSTAAALVATAVGVGLAVAGADVWALVAMAVTEAAAATILGWILSLRAGVWRPRLGWDVAAFRELMGFGAFVTGGRIVNYGQLNADNLIVGKVLGAVPLGYYALAYRTVLLPVTKVSDVITSTAFPVLSRVSTEADRFRSGFVQANRYIAVVTFPVTVGLAVSAPQLVPVMFGEQWRPAVRAVQLLALAGPLISLVRLDNAAYRASGRPQWGLWVSTIKLGLYVPAFIVGVRYGVDGVAAAFLLTSVATIPLLVVLRSRLLGLGLLEQLGPFAAILAATVVMAGAAVGARAVTPGGELAQLGAMVAAGAVTYGLAVVVLDRALVRSLLADLRR